MEEGLSSLDDVATVYSHFFKQKRFPLYFVIIYRTRFVFNSLDRH